MSEDIIKQAKERAKGMMLMLEPLVDQIILVDLRLETGSLNEYAVSELENIRKWSLEEINKLFDKQNQK